MRRAMRRGMRRLLAVAAAGYVGSIWAGVTFGCWPAWASVGVVLCATLLFATRLAWANAGPASVGVVLAVCATAGLTSRATPADARAPLRALARLEGRVVATYEGGSVALLEVERGVSIDQDVAVARGTRVRVRGARLLEGTRVRLVAQLVPRASFRNPSPHPPWPDARPVDANARVVDSRAVVVLDASGPGAWIGALRARVRAALDRTLDIRTAGVARALVLGDGDAVDADDQLAIRGAGLSHALAVSGLHVTVLCGLLVALLRRAIALVPGVARRAPPERVACAIGVAVALLYAPIAGGAPSAWRAAVTAAIAWALVAVGRRPDAASVTAVAALAFAVASPAEATRPAFVLSIAATAALLTGARAAGDGAWAFLRAGLTTAARATLATAPVVLWCFESMPVAGIAANAVLVPLASIVLLPLAALHACLATLAPDACVITAGPLRVVSDAFVGGAELFATVGPSAAPPPLTVVQGLALAAGAAALLLTRGLRVRVVVAVATLAAAVVGELHVRATERPHGIVRATFLDVGQGDATLLDMPDGRVVLVDAGGRVLGGPDPGKAVLVPLLRARRRDRVDIAVLTHPHPDHYGGLDALFDGVPVGELWHSGQAEDEEAKGHAAAIIRRARTVGTRVRRASELCGRAARFGAATLRVIAPCPTWDPGYDANDNSIVLLVTLGRRRLLLAGDVEALTEARLVRTGVMLSADVLKVGHHGSRTSSTPPFLRAVGARVAVVSAGFGNTFGHPHADVLERLRAAHATVLRTDADGGTIVVTDGASLEARAWNGRAVGWP